MSRIRMIDGGSFDYLDPESTPQDIETLVWHLAHICRFTGAVNNMYSVLQHSYLAATVVRDPRHAYPALMHDIAEAVLGDVNAPLKSLLPDYKAIEERIERIMLPWFGLTFEDIHHPEVKRADTIMYVTERRDFCNVLPWCDLETDYGVDPLPTQLTPWSPSYMRFMFLARFERLKDQHERFYS